MGYGSTSLDHKGCTPFNEAARGKPPEPSNKLPIVRNLRLFTFSSFPGVICSTSMQKKNSYLQIRLSYNRSSDILKCHFFNNSASYNQVKKRCKIKGFGKDTNVPSKLRSSKKRPTIMSVASKRYLRLYFIGTTAIPFSVFTNISGVLNISLYFSQSSSDRLSKDSLSNGA